MTDFTSPLMSDIIYTCNRPAQLERARDFRFGQRVRLLHSEHCGIGLTRSQALKLARGVFPAYCEPPADDRTGIRELKRGREAGTQFVVFAWPDRPVIFDLQDHSSGRQRAGNYD